MKRAARQLVERHYLKLTFDFHIKKILADNAEVSTKRLRNKIAGYATHLMKRIQKGPVKRISLKIQEEERERRLDFIPEKSAIDIEQVAEVDSRTYNLLRYALVHAATLSLDSLTSSERSCQRRRRSLKERF